MRFGKSFFKKIYKAHIYAGIFIAIHFAIFALTGLPLLFKDELQNSNDESETHTALDTDATAKGYDLAFANMLTTYPKDKPLALFPDEHDPKLLNARLGIDGAIKLRGSRRATYDLASGNEVGEKPKTNSGFFDWILRLHRELLLGSNGKLYIGLVGLVYVFMLISGFFIYGNFMRGRNFGDIRTGKLPRMIDIHKFAGMLSFGWGLVVGLSGALLAFNGILIKLFQYSSLKHLTAQYKNFQEAAGQSASLRDVVTTALRAKADTVVSYISFPNTEFGIPGHFLVLTNGTDTVSSRISELLVIDSRTATLTETVQLPFYLKAALLSEPLHFGNYGGIFLKVIWALFTLISLLVVGLGFWSFILKRQRRSGTVPTPASPKVVRTPPRYPYAKPYALAFVSILGLFTALFATGLVAKSSAALLLIPLAIGIVAMVRRKNA